jgi:hypothetical protein
MVLRCSLRHGASTAHSRETSLQNTEFHVGTENQIQLTRDIPYHSSVQVAYVQQHRLSGYSSFPVLRSLSILRVTA